MLTKPKIDFVAGTYRFQWEAMGVEVGLSRIKQHSDSTTSLIEVHAGKRIILSPKRFTIDGTNTAATLANLLEKRFSLTENEESWDHLLEIVCNEVMTKTMQGEPAESLDVEPLNQEPQYLIKPVVFSNQFTLLYAPRQTGKSYLAQFYGTLIQNGINDFRGIEVKKANVLYLDYETDVEIMRQRAKRIKNGLGSLSLESPTYRRCYTSFANDLAAISKIVMDKQIGAIIVDSMGQACGGDLNSEQTVLQFFEAFRALPNLTLIGLHHVNKEQQNNPKGAKDPHGSNYFSNLPRSTWEIKQMNPDDDEDPDESEVVIAMFNRKNNLTKRAKPVGFKMRFDPWTTEFEVTDPLKTFSEEMTQPQKAMALMKERGKISPKDLADYLELTGTNAKTQARSILDRLVKKQIVQKLSPTSYGASYVR